MHVPDGIVPIWLQILLLVVSASMMAIAYRKVKQNLSEKIVPFMGVLAAVIFAAQLVNFPVPPFSSGHLVGSTLLAVMVGPWVAMIIMALVLFVQALYGDGGILTYGLNLFNMGVFSVLLGYGLALLLFKTLRRFVKKESATVLSAGVASFIVTVGAAFVLGLQLLTVGGFGVEALVAITGVHTIIGVGEATLTSVILLYFVKANPQLVMFLRTEKSVESDESEEQEVPVEESKKRIIRQTVPVIAASIILVAIMILAGLASENPDGFEWALFVFAGITEPTHSFEGVWSFLAAGPFTDLITGTIGVMIAVGLGFLIFRRTSKKPHDHTHTDKFLLPFDEGKQSRGLFSSTGMIVTAVALAILISLQSSLAVVLMIISLVLVAGWFSGTRWGSVLSLAAKFEIIILFWVFFEPFLYGSTIIYTINLPWGQVYAYSEGLYLGLLLGSRMFAILLTFLATLSHMTLSEFIGALRTLKIPSSILGSMLIMFRYVPLFMEERSRMQDAQSLRGFNRGRRFERIRSLGYLVGTSINRSFDRSVTAYESMTLRGFSKGMIVSGAGLKRSDALLPLLVTTLLVSIPFLVPLIMEVLLL
ncbi:MAG: energy-coupling factor ABC transporter permease [Candidatus Thorarchaeota archaeon]|jgi:cobalt/nickel transport system permease protein